MKATLNNEKTNIQVFFSYSESCRNVYKNFGVTINGKNSNRTGLKKYLVNTDFPQIILANTYFWTPSIGASDRRRNEKRRLNEVTEFFRKNGFIIES